MPFDLAGYLAAQGGGGAYGATGFDPKMLQQYGINLNQLFGNQQGYIKGLGSPGTGNMSNVMNQLMGMQNTSQVNPFINQLSGFQASGANPFINQLGGFNPALAGDVRGALSGVMQNPWSAAGTSTLNEMLTTGAPTDVAGLGNAAAMRANQAFEQMAGAGTEARAISGGLSGSGYDAMLGRIGGSLAEQMQQQILQGQFAANEAAQARRMGALGLDLQGAGTRAGAAGTLGGLENQLSGQRLQALLGGGDLAQGQDAMQLQALLGGGQLANQADDTRLRAMLGAGNMASGIDQLRFAGQQSQAGAGQSFLNSLPGFAQAGMFSGPGGPMSAEAIAHYIRTIGGAENQNLQGMMHVLSNPYYSNPTRASTPAAPQAGGAGGLSGAQKFGVGSELRSIQDQLDAYDARNFGGIGQMMPLASVDKENRKLHDLMSRKLELMGQLGVKSPAPLSPAGGPSIPGAGGGFQMPNYTPATFTPSGQPLAPHPASQPPASYDQWANYWNMYAQQFADPSRFTAGGFAA